MRLAERALSLLWPRGGFRRAGRYYVRRIQRIPGTPHRLAAGLACGAAVSMTPFVGLHGVSAVLLAWLMRGSWVTALIGTVVGNPWTFPVIWVATFQLGSSLLPSAEGDGGVSLGAVGQEVLLLFSAAKDMATAWDLDAALRDLRMMRLIPVMAVGSVPFVVVVWVASYVGVRLLVAQYRRLRAKRMARRHAAAPAP